MGKTAAGAIWLDPTRTSPHDFFQYWVNIDDSDVERFLALFTFLPMEEVRRLGALAGADLREAKQVLAYEVTSLVHGEAAAQNARQASAVLFGGSSDEAAIPTTTIIVNSTEVITVLDLLVMCGLSESRSAGRRLISQGGVMLAGARGGDPELAVTEDTFREGTVLLRAGKKRFHRFVLAPKVPN